MFGVGGVLGSSFFVLLLRWKGMRERHETWDGIGFGGRGRHLLVNRTVNEPEYVDVIHIVHGRKGDPGRSDWSQGRRKDIEGVGRAKISEAWASGEMKLYMWVVLCLISYCSARYLTSGAKAKWAPLLRFVSKALLECRQENVHGEDERPEEWLAG